MIGIPIQYAYTIEIGEQSTLHLHLMLIIECTANHINPMTVFFHKVRSAILSLKNVKWCNIPKRQLKPHNLHHCLKQPIEFMDAITRYSYLAKINNKQGVKGKFKKAFATSQINHYRYYSLLGNHIMLKIKPIQKNNTFSVFSDHNINQQYIRTRQYKNSDNETKNIFHFENIKNNKIVGYYSLSHSIALDDESDVKDLMICLDGLFIEDAYREDNEWFEIFLLHLNSEIEKIITSNHLGDSPIIQIFSEQEPWLEALNWAVQIACDDQGISYESPAISE